MRCAHRVHCALALSGVLLLLLFARIDAPPGPSEAEPAALVSSSQGGTIGRNGRVAAHHLDPTTSPPRARPRSQTRFGADRTGLRPPAPRPPMATAASGDLDTPMIGTGADGSPTMTASPRPTDVHPATPRLEPLALEPGALSLRPAGEDPDGPRDLTLWRVGGDSFARIANTRSSDDGTFVFGQLLIPIHGIELLVTSADRTPEASDRDAVRSIAGRLPPPQIVSRPTQGHAVELDVRLAIPGGTLRLIDVDGAAIASFDLEGDPEPGVRIELEGLDEEGFILVSQALRDGRTSRWREVPLPRVRSAAQ